MSDQQATPTPEPDGFSFGSAMQALDALYNALPKSKRLEYIGEFNEVAVVLTAGAGLVGVVRDTPQWRTALRALPRLEASQS